MKGAVFSANPIIAIDVGTTKICVLAAQPIDKERLEIVGVGKAPSIGLRKGIVVDISKTIHSIKQAVAEAELMAGCKIESACIGIAGSHIQSINSHGAVPIKREEVTRQDINNVLAAAQAVAIPEGQQILHVLPQYFVVDNHEPLHDPLGMHGVRLEVRVHIITGSIASVQDLVICCEKAGIKATDIVLEQLASARAVLSPDERELGVGILDIGGGTSDLAIYKNGSIIYTMVLPVAGNHFTNDLALGLRITLNDAERIKKECGYVYKDVMQSDGYIDVESVEGGATKHIMYSELSRILQPRGQELFTLVNDSLVKANLQHFLSTGLVLTGGGALLEGIAPLASHIFQIPVRVGKPQIKESMLESLDNPMYATGYGLLLHALKKQDAAHIERMSGPLVVKIVSRMKSWVSDFF